MTANAEELELKDRLSLIESMIAEGRRTTESWGWTFVLWGVAYYVAIAWDILGHNPWAWVITMTIAWLLMMAILWRKAKQQTEKKPSTWAGRSISSIWTALGISMMLLFPAMGFSGRFTPQTFVAVAGAMLGMTNAASSMILKWKAQLACAVVWWVAGAVACFTNIMQCTIVFLAAIFLCQIVFGVYAIIGETRRRKQQEAAHA
ncbi:MAG: hypothetical protein ACLQGT_06455 [Terracidiphilus sp.]